MRRLAILLALVLPPAALAGDAALLAAKERYLPAARAAYADTPDGAQARYDAGRDLVEAVLAAGAVSAERRSLRVELLAQGRRQVARAEALDRDPGFSSTGPLAALPAASAGLGPRRPDAALASRLAAAARRVDGAVGIWVHELATGGYAGYAADTPFAAASTVKLGPVVAALRASPRPERGRWWYDVRQIGFWSSNLAANRIARQVGYAAVRRGLLRLGMTSSTYPGAYRATTAYRPPGPHTRVTTARDLGRALYRLHAAAYGDARALRLLGLSRAQAGLALRVLASSQPVSENVGLLRPWLPGALLAEKNGWLSDTRTTAAIVYRGRSATIVVVEIFRPGITFAEAQRVGREIVAAAGLPARRPAAAAAAPAFSSVVEPVRTSDLRYSYRAGCPVPPARLRALRVSYWDFAGRRREGRIVVARSRVPAAVTVFRKLWLARFPIRRLRPVSAYRGSDDASMAADNTSGFNCRVVRGTSRWSLHAYGEAIDVNPVENPYVRGPNVSPAAGRAFVDRSRYRKGMAVGDGVLVRAFASVGWKWGASFGDYQHFSPTGR